MWNCPLLNYGHRSPLEILTSGWSTGNLINTVKKIQKTSQQKWGLFWITKKVKVPNLDHDDKKMNASKDHLYCMFDLGFLHIPRTESNLDITPKSLYRNRTGSHFYGKIWDLGWFWAGWQYWQKNLGQLWTTFEGSFFMF